MNPWDESKTMNKLEEKKSFRMEGGFLFVFLSLMPSLILMNISLLLVIKFR